MAGPRYVLWKRYAFRHIIKTDKKTYCGNDWGWTRDFRAKYNGFILYDKDTEYRPLCGTCHKLFEKDRETKGLG